jgi:O-methyltransferase
LACEITRKNVKGNVAELGVYKGEFSKKINKLFPDRTLYMFDTFEGFDQRDTKSVRWCDRLNQFDSVEVKNILKNMPFPEKCCVKKGYFPDTYDVEEKFAFVSIDADLYNPIKSGLEIFYPNLSEGGYIMVHDYNNIAYSGAMDAVIEYCDQNNISYVPIPDICGSVVITK